MFDFNLARAVPEAAPSFAKLTDSIFTDTTRFALAALNSRGTARASFDQLPALELLLAAYAKSGDARYLNVVKAAANRLAEQLTDLQDGKDAAPLLQLALRLYELKTDSAYRELARAVIERIEAAFLNKQAVYFRTSCDAAGFETGLNAALGEAYYHAWRVLEDQERRSVAGQVLGHVSEMFDPQQGLGSRRNADLIPTAERALLGDYAATIQLFMTAAETTARPTYLGRAMTLADYALAHAVELQGRFQEHVAFADALTRLHQFTGEAKYHSAAGARLESLAESYQEHGTQAAGYALAVDHWLHFPLHIAVVGDTDADDTRRLLAAALKQYASARAVESLCSDLAHQADAPGTWDQARLQALGYSPARDGTARAWICIGPMCLPPISMPEQITAAVKRARR